MNKLKFLSWFALTVFSATAWAGTQEGPWSYFDYRTGRYDKTNSSYYARSYEDLNKQWWDEPRQWGDGDGIGLTVEGKSGSKEKQCTYSLYHANVNVESFSRQRLNWTFKLGAYSKQHHSITSLYGGFTDLTVLANTKVDCTENYSDGSGAAYRLLDPFKHTSEGKAYTGEVTKTFYFDNSTGTSAANKDNYLLLVHVITSGDDGKSDLHEWGAFKHVNMTWDYDYYKHIIFYGNGATSGSMGNQTIENSGNLNANAYSRTGYTFDGWATSATGGKVYNNQAGIAATQNDKGNIPLYAHWIANQYTVSFDKRSGSGGSASVSATFDAAMPSMTKPTRTGYTFNGYYDQTSGGTQYYKADGSSARTWNKASNTTLYAQWTTVNYTIGYTLNGGSVSGNPANYNIETATFTLKNPTRTGYTFKGWTGSNGSTPQTSVSIAKGSTGNKTYTANWTPENYTIGYTLNGGSVTGNPANYNIETATITLNNPTRTGYTFKGWTGSNGSTPQMTVQIAKGSTGNKTYTANWNPITYNITYDYAKGTGNNPATYNPDMATFQLAAPTRLGYTFLGWTGSSGDVPQLVVEIAKGSTGDRNYVAHWAINPNTNVAYLDSLDNTAAQEIVAFNRPEAPEVAGFTFLRWEVQEGPLSEGITLQAIYTENEPSGAPKKQVGKFTLTRKGDKNEYILQTAK